MKSEADSLFLGGKTMVTPQLTVPRLQSSPGLLLPQHDGLENLFLLDRNAVSLILRHSRATIIRGGTEYRHIRQLERLDKRGNLISLFASTLEGINPKKETITSDYRIRCLRDEINAVKNFYKKARTDADFLSSRASILSSCDMFDSFPRCMHFLCEASSLLYQPVSSTTYDTVCHDILEIAKICDIPKGHPVVMCALACLYGNEDARDMLKFKKNYSFSTAYNAMSDITTILFTASTNELMRSQHSSNSKIHFFSFDKALIKIFNSFVTSGFHAEYKKIVPPDGSGGEQSVSFTVGKLPHEFFPKCSDEQYNELIKLLYDV